MSLIASTSDDLKIHQWSNGEEKQQYEVQPPIKTISWSRDGAWILLVPNTGFAQIVRIKNNFKVLQRIRNVFQSTCAVFQNTTKRNVALGTISGQVLIFDIKQRAIKKRFPSAPSTIFDVKYNSKDSHISASCINGDILIFNNLSSFISSCYRVPQSNSVSATNFHFTKRNLFAAGSEEGVIATWDINTNAILCVIQAHQAPVTGVTFSPIRSDLLISSGLDRRFSFYDLLSKKCVIEVEVANCTTALDFSPCGAYLATGLQNGHISIYDIRNFNTPISTFVGHSEKKIRNLHFQKSTIDNDNENCSFYFEEESLKDHSLPHKNLVDSIELIMYDDRNTGMKQNTSLSTTTHDKGDSFLAALGLDNSRNILETPTKHDQSVVEDISKYKEIPMPIPQHVIASETVTNFKVKQTSSTPKHVIDTLSTIIESPILSAAQTRAFTDECKDTIKEIIKEELESQFKSFANDLRYKFLEETHCISEQILNLHMSVVRQSVEIDAKLEDIQKNLKKREINGKTNQNW
ncbi:hypothetical protein FQA39_LY00849 [Lamprigera yunnana]|nr:hypothetical protein FQA39_LY00849 [Lamprigera yunnana]